MLTLFFIALLFAVVFFCFQAFCSRGLSFFSPAGF